MLLLTAVASILGAASVVNALRNVTVYANDTSIQYTGLDWKPYTNCGGTYYTYSTGNFFQYSFTGVAVYLYTTRSPEGGLISFSVDGQSTTADRQAPLPYNCGYGLFSSPSLENGRHTVTVSFVGNSITNTTARGFIEWQWLIYTELEAGEAILPSSTYPLSSGTIGGVVTGTANPNNKDSGSNAAVIGGAIGGVVGGLALIGLIGFLIWRNKRNNAHRAHGLTDLGAEYEPKPFEAPQPSRLSMGVVPAVGMQPHGGHGHGSTTNLNQYGPGAPYPNQGGQYLPGQHPGIHHPQSPPGFAPPNAGYAPSAAAYSSGYPTSAVSSHPSPPGGAPPFDPYAASSTSGSGASSNRPLMLHSASSGLQDDDVQRIAARVASMMGPGTQQGGGPQPSASADYDAPPPMYNEKPPIR
ncbi:hypothetical protein FRC02_002872 [Tulasnella sp. 418]|nr:hypothetical protein FRC02_002872 [Tulasnella sp. 418]